MLRTKTMRRIAVGMALTATAVGTAGVALADTASDATAVAQNAPNASTDAFHGAPGVGGGINRGTANVVDGSFTQGFADIFLGLYFAQAETTHGSSLQTTVDPPVLQSIEAVKNSMETFVEPTLQTGVGDLLAGPLQPAVSPVSDLVRSFPR